MKYAFICLITILACNSAPKKNQDNNHTGAHTPAENLKIVTGANQTEAYLKLLEGKKVGVVANQTSVIFKNASQDSYTHIVDSLIAMNVNVTTVFAPEHGFRGTADAGEYIEDGVDDKTGLPVFSLYGKNRKAPPEFLKNVDVMLFDVQDVGVRFYTYISTLHYVMEIAAELNVPVIVLDRPNPNGHYIDGPVLESDVKSFVGMHPVPIVYGMTIGEYGKMINGEKWLENGIECDLTVVPLKNYTYASEYDLPILPSPNLPNAKSINLYPSVCFFEGTTVSCGRGTEMQFQIFGAPYLPKEQFNFSFTPQPNFGAKTPKHQGELCYGKDLREVERLNEIRLDWLIQAYNGAPDKKTFFNDFFKKLAGTTKLQTQIAQGMSIDEIKKTWQSGLESFKETRAKYVLYD
ncbi:uncharacterized protein YbbC (DUF1343 family) [Gelidibacter sediminis]|uniref:Uncharacterized protein YbbC (DUF1343 family) n=1 Tax=Gelidibacter sediminis TaxID=1608710 RepID=A0A4R7PZ79_9FLAO|nr:DUF1343 domain-containing protein [Gelidibacter sediminis]TDU40327.1 uncharacterized protein YbbC (DUF1343 family) [Gelidibacter sediminis]